MSNELKYGIVLGGGGAKGAYEIGVWKALREMGISIGAVVGTSVGALNGAMIVQNDFDLASNMWNDLTMSRIINMGQAEDLVGKNNLSVTSIMRTIKNSILSGGMDVTPLKELLNKIIDEKKIRESEIDFGIVTFSLSDFKPVNLFKKDIPEGQLVDYLLASSCFPTFKPHIIDNKRYLDGGLYDNIPVSLLLGRINNIIMVDVSGPGRIRRVDTKDHEIICIKNSEYLGRTLQFDGENSKSNIDYGYYDTLRAFGEIKGKKYYISEKRQQPTADKEIIWALEPQEIERMHRFYGTTSKSKPSKVISEIKYRIIKLIRGYTIEELDEQNTFLAMAEICAEVLDIDRKCTYNLEELIEEIFDKYTDYKKVLLTTSNTISIEKLMNFNKNLVFYEPDLYETNPDVIKKRKIMAVSDTKSAVANLFLALMVFRKLGL